MEMERGKISVVLPKAVRGDLGKRENQPPGAANRAERLIPPCVSIFCGPERPSDRARSTADRILTAVCPSSACFQGTSIWYSLILLKRPFSLSPSVSAVCLRLPPL